MQQEADEKLGVQTVLTRGSKHLIEIHTAASSSAGFPGADRTDPAVQNHAECSFPPDYLFLQHLDSDTFDLKIDQIVPNFFSFFVISVAYFFSKNLFRKVYYGISIILEVLLFDVMSDNNLCREHK